MEKGELAIRSFLLVLSQSEAEHGLIKISYDAYDYQQLFGMRQIVRKAVVAYRFSSGKRSQIREEQQFRRCVFDGDVTSLKLNEGQFPMYPWFAKYSSLMRLSTTDKDANSAAVNSYQQTHNSPHELALALQWISTLTHRLRSDIIHPQCYKALLSKYYAHFNPQISPEKSSKVVLNPKLPLQSLLVKSFIYLHHEDIGKLVKQNQLFLLEKMSHFREVGISEFSTVIDHNVFNVTDLPMLKTHFFNTYFPQIPALANLRQIQRTMAYLSNFSVLPISFPRFYLHFLQKYIKHNEKIPISDLLSISNILFQLVFHFHSTFQQSKQVSNYAKCLDQLLNKTVVWQDQDQKLGLLIKNNAKLNQLIESNISMEVKAMEKTIAEEQTVLDRLSLTPNLCLDVILRKKLDLTKGWKLLALLKKKSEVEIRTKLTRFMFAASFIDVSLLDTFYRYLQFPKTFEFYMENPYIPNLLRYTKVALQLAQNRQIHQNIKEVADYFSKELNKRCLIINNYLQSIEKDAQELMNEEENRQVMNDIVLEEKFENIIIRQDSSSVELEKLVNNKYNYEETVINLLKMLKNDQIFMSSLIKWNTNKYLSESCIKNMNFHKHTPSYWQYPYLFSHRIVNINHQILKFHLKTAFNSNAILPRKGQAQKQAFYQGQVDNLQGAKIRLSQHASKP